MKYTIAALALLATTPVFAQDRMSALDCEQSWAGVLGSTGLPMGQLQVDVDPSGWCVIQDGTANFFGGSRVRIDSLMWRASEIDRFIEDGLPPRSIEIVGDGVGVLPQTGDAVYDYLFSLQTEESNLGFGLTVRWDGVQNALMVDESYVVFDDTNRIDITARIDGVDLTDSATIQTSLGTMGLRNLSVKTTFDGWFEQYVALPVGAGLLTDTTAPEDQVAALQQQAIDFSTSLPTDILPTVAQDALAGFITELPRPRGTLQLQLNADPIINAARALPMVSASDSVDAAQRFSEFMDGVRLLITWSPTRE